jgi:hypothetical protein
MDFCRNIGIAAEMSAVVGTRRVRKTAFRLAILSSCCKSALTTSGYASTLMFAATVGNLRWHALTCCNLANLVLRVPPRLIQKIEKDDGNENAPKLSGVGFVSLPPRALSAPDSRDL